MRGKLALALLVATLVLSAGAISVAAQPAAVPAAAPAAPAIAAQVQQAMPVAAVVAQATPPAADPDWTCPRADGDTFGPRGPMMGGAGFGMGIWDEDSTLAKTLGMTAQELADARHAGKSLAQIAADKGVAKETLTKALLDERKAWLDELVKAGRITQAQADLMLENMKSMVATMIERQGFGPMMGGGRGPMMGPGRNGAQSGTPAPGQGFGPGSGRMGPYWQNQDGTTAPSGQRFGPGMMGGRGIRG